MKKCLNSQEEKSRFLKDNLNYTTENTSSNLKKGTVYISFLVEQSGKITDVELSKGLNQYFDQEAIRVIKLMPDWIPGEQSGVIVKVRYTLPIKFEKPR